MSAKPEQPGRPSGKPTPDASGPGIDEGLTFEQAHQELEDIVHVFGIGSWAFLSRCRRGRRSRYVPEGLQLGSCLRIQFGPC